jgi:hypothetical protein
MPLFTRVLRETVWKVRMGGELVLCQVNKTAPRGLLRALHTTEDPLLRALQRLSRQSLEGAFSEVHIQDSVYPRSNTYERFSDFLTNRVQLLRPFLCPNGKRQRKEERWRTRPRAR